MKYNNLVRIKKKATSPVNGTAPIAGGYKDDAFDTNKLSLSSQDVKGSVKDPGYHAGDLGKAESLFNQSGCRSTGHFGTGTYFVGNQAKIEGYNYL